MFFRADKTAAEEKEEKEERERSEGESKALFFIMRYQPGFVMRAISTSTGGGGGARVAEGVAEGEHGWRRGARVADAVSALPFSTEVKPGWTRFIAG